MKKQLLHALRGPLSRKIQLLVFLLICIYVFQQVSYKIKAFKIAKKNTNNIIQRIKIKHYLSNYKALTSFGDNPYIESNGNVQGALYYPPINTIIEEKNAKKLHKWKKKDAGLITLRINAKYQKTCIELK